MKMHKIISIHLGNPNLPKSNHQQSTTTTVNNQDFPITSKIEGKDKGKRKKKSIHRNQIQVKKKS